MKKSLVSLALACSLVAVSAQAAAVFEDDFNSGPYTTNWTGQPGKWTVTNGTIDRIADNTYGLRCAGLTGGCIDLDGSTGDSGVLTSTTFSLVAGTTYSISALISRSPAGSTPDQLSPNAVKMTLLDTLAQNTVPGPLSSDALFSGPIDYQSIGFLFTPSITSLFTLSFENFRPDTRSYLGDNVGAMLDNVSVTAVPLPAAAWLLLSGLGGVAAFARRRRETAAT